ncbi:MAG TPA: hypothetical protein VMJ12_05710 [Candidatus Acidoferrales bacterium]|nr:hypothetical protein [Candidatus Acidoferrales bacterium]
MHQGNKELKKEGALVDPASHDNEASVKIMGARGKGRFTIEMHISGHTGNYIFVKQDLEFVRFVQLQVGTRKNDASQTQDMCTPLPAQRGQRLAVVYQQQDHKREKYSRNGPITAFYDQQFGHSGINEDKPSREHQRSGQDPNGQFEYMFIISHVMKSLSNEKKSRL